MNDIITRIYDDIEEYESLCRYFKEEIQYKITGYGKSQDCYGEHAEELKKRYRNES